MVNAGVEVGVVAHLARQAQLHLRLAQQRIGPHFLQSRALTQPFPQRYTQSTSFGYRLGHQAVHVAVINQARRMQVQHPVANGHSNSPGFQPVMAKPAKRQVLNWKIGV